MATAVLCLLAACALPRPAPALEVQDVVGEISLSTYRDFLDNRLYARTGDDRGFQLVGGGYVPTADHDAARDNVLSSFAGLGLQASLDPFSFTLGGKTYAGCNNVLGVLPGRIHPERLYVIGGHYDSVNYPGADDNASGVAGVMEAARVLSQYAFDSTILFAAWDGEEKGLKGSNHWVEAHDEGAVDGLANLDMIACNYDADRDGQGDNVATIYGQAGWREKWRAAAERYAPGISLVVDTQAVQFSDHWPFEQAGRPAGGIIENTYMPLPNPNYHKLADCVDTAGYLDYDFALKLLGGAVGLIAEEAGLLLPGDTDLDGDVDACDYVTLKRHYGSFGAGWRDGDFDADGDVDGQDLFVLRDHFGQTLALGAGAGAAVPEPATLLLLAIGAVGLLRRRQV